MALKMYDEFDVNNNIIDHPNYVGKTEDDARKKLEKANLSHHFHLYDATIMVLVLDPFR